MLGSRKIPNIRMNTDWKLHEALERMAMAAQIDTIVSVICSQYMQPISAILDSLFKQKTPKSSTVSSDY